MSSSNLTINTKVDIRSPLQSPLFTSLPNSSDEKVSLFNLNEIKICPNAPRKLKPSRTNLELNESVCRRLF